MRRENLALRSTPMQENWKSAERNGTPRISARMNVPSHKLVLHRKEDVYSVSVHGLRRTHRCIVCRASSARIRAARRCAAGSPTDSSLMEPVNTARGTLCFPNEIPKIYFRNSPPPPPPPFILDEIFRLALITPDLRNDRYLLLHCRFCYCSAQPVTSTFARWRCIIICD